MSTLRIIRIRNNTNETKNWVKDFLPNEEYTIPNDTSIYYRYRTNNNLLSDIGNGDASIGDAGEYYTDVNEQIHWLLGLPDARYTADGKIRIAISPEDHAETHQVGGADEINVQDLSGQLADEQHPVPQECVDAMGAKNNNNPLHHDRYQQSEINNLPENQLSLNYPTHDNSNDPSTAQKQAMENANGPASGNPFATIDDLSGYSPTGHTHSTLPTQDEKDALAGNSPSSSNKYATMGDLANVDNSKIATSFNTLPASPPTGEIWKTLEDYADTNTYEAGWYEYLGSGNGGGVHGSDWKFYSTMEVHTHTWSQVTKSGSKVSDIADVPSYPNDGKENELIEENGSLSWKEKASGSGSGKRSLQLDLVYGSSTSQNWMTLSDIRIKSSECGWTPPFNCKVREVIYTNKNTGSSGQIVKLSALYRDRSNTSYFSTSDPEEWYCDNNNSPNLMYNEGNGKRWGYDCTNDNDEMLQSRAYAFRIKRTYGYSNMDDIKITVMLEEV